MTQVQSRRAADKDVWGSQGRSQSQRSSPKTIEVGGRLILETVLIALCGYLIGTGGIPPFFGPPGGALATVVASESVDEDQVSDVGSPEDEVVETEGDAAVAVSQPGTGTTVTVGRPNWSAGYFQAEVFAALLRELGYNVADPAEGEYGPEDAFTKIADGSLDFWASTWRLDHETFLADTLDDGSVVADRVSPVGNLLPAGGIQGIVINQTVAQENGITSLSQINADPELRALFDTDGDGRAEIFGCPEDWTCDDIINEMLTFNAWDGLVQIQAPYQASMEQAVERVEAGTPVLIYTWSPSAHLTRLRPGDNVLWLSLGSADNVLDGSITPDFNYADLPPGNLGAACSEDPCWTGWPTTDIGVTANNDFLAANPAAKALFEQVQLGVIDVALAGVKLEAGEDSPEDLVRHAEAWIAANRSVVDEWLNSARSAS